MRYVASTIQLTDDVLGSCAVGSPDLKATLSADESIFHLFYFLFLFVSRLAGLGCRAHLDVVME